MAKATNIPPIVQDGDPVLRGVARPITPLEIGTPELTKILADMNAALDREHDGVAIAAPQIGVPLRIFIVSNKAFMLNERGERVQGDTPIPDANMVFINPEITKLSKKRMRVPEGCLSVRWLYGTTVRSEKATIRAIDETGKQFSYGGSGLLAQIFQHETDHLNGILFIDHATDIEQLSEEEVAKIQAEAEKNRTS